MIHITAQMRVCLGGPGAKLIYTYDFGDNCEHAIVLDKTASTPPCYEQPGLHRWKSRMSARRLRRHPRIL
jgi:hypothetical protein